MARRNEVTEEEKISVAEKNKSNGEQVPPDENIIDSIEEGKELIEDLFEKAEALAKTNVDLIKLQVVGKLSVVLASLVTRMVVIIFVSLFFFMINIGVALWLGELLGHTYEGFFIVAGLYALFALVFYVYRDPILKNPIINSMISQFLK